MCWSNATPRYQCHFVPAFAWNSIYNNNNSSSCCRSYTKKYTVQLHICMCVHSMHHWRLMFMPTEPIPSTNVHVKFMHVKGISSIHTKPYMHRRRQLSGNDYGINNNMLCKTKRKIYIAREQFRYISIAYNILTSFWNFSLIFFVVVVCNQYHIHGCFWTHPENRDSSYCSRCVAGIL